MTAWEKLASDKANPQPTPPIGEPIVWFIEGDRTKRVAGQVTGVEGPGRLKIVVHPVGNFQQHKTGCFHISNTIHERPNATTKNNGAWDYPRGKAPKEDFSLHNEEMARREAQLVKADEVQKKAEERMQRLADGDEEPEVKPKRRMVDPIASPF